MRELGWRDASEGFLYRLVSRAASRHYEGENDDEARQAKVLTKHEARRITINVARLLEPIGKVDPDQSRTLSEPLERSRLTAGPQGTSCVPRE
jgi:hypothetical protein